jgi:hypothetical protein
MRVISSWLNDTDRRDANTMAVYNDSGYIDHYVQDFGNTLGANGTSIHQPIQGQAYLIDPRYMLVSALSLGGYVTPWETIEAGVPYPAAGYFRADVFKPGRWVPTHPLPPFENMTLRDAFWGAKQVMSFSNEDIQAIVATGKYSNPKAEEYITETLIARRDKIGRYWFAKINPLDRFQVDIASDSLQLSFDDLAVTSKLVDASAHQYAAKVTLGRKILEDELHASRPAFTVSLNETIIDSNQKTVLKFLIRTKGDPPAGNGKTVAVYVEIQGDESRVVGIQREE